MAGPDRRRHRWFHHPRARRDCLGYEYLYTTRESCTNTSTVEIIKSNRPPLNKVIWCLVVFLFPLVGMLIYYLFSNRASHNSSGYEAIPS